MGDTLELLKIKDGEVVQRIVLDTKKKQQQAEQMAMVYLDKKKTKKRDKKHRTWFYSNESNIPVSEQFASRAIQNGIDMLNAERIAFEKEKAEFEAWKASQSKSSLVSLDDEDIPKPKGRPKKEIESPNQ